VRAMTITRASTRRRPVRGIQPVLVTLVTTLLAACTGGNDLESVTARLNAVPFGMPFQMPDRELTATDGTAYNLRAETEDRFVLVFYGYTHCPDICPITMAVATAALEQMTPEESARVEVLFVTVDPRRDTPQRIEEWLGAMGSPAVGLRGSMEEVETVLGEMGMALPPAPTEHDGHDSTEMESDYLVAHPSSMLMVTPDGVGRFVYGFDRVTPGQMAEDLRALMALDWEGG